MSQSLLYHAFGVEKGYEYQKTDYVKGRVEFYLRVDPSYLVCPECGTREVTRKGRRWRRVRSVPIGMKPVVLVVEVPRAECSHCNKTFEVSPPLPEPTFTTPLDLLAMRAT